MKNTPKENSELLAYKFEGRRHEKKYHAGDLRRKEHVIELFDYCQLLLAYITPSGWQYLITTFGYDDLFAWNSESGWMDCRDIEEFKSDIQQYIAGDNTNHAV